LQDPSENYKYIRADCHLLLGDCGMGMPVFRTWQAMEVLPMGSVVHVASAHP